MGSTIGSGQFTIIDFNDVNINMTEPTTKVTDMLWLDTSVTPNTLKRWDGLQWVNSRALSLSELDSAADANLNLVVGKVDDIFGDTKITPEEKRILKQEFDSIAIEKGSIYNQALTYNLDSDATTFSNTYDALNTAISPYLTDLTTTSTINNPDTATTLRDKFVQYYNQKASLIKKITDKGTNKTKIIETINQSAETVFIKTNKLTICGNPNILPNNLASFENYENNSEALIVAANPTVTTAIPSSDFALDGKISFKVVTGATNTDGYVYLADTPTTYNIPLIAEKYYCLSFYVKVMSNSTAIQGYARTNDASATHFSSSATVNIADGWKRLYKVFQAPTGTTACNIRVDVDKASATAYFDCFQLEEVYNLLNEPGEWKTPSQTIINGNTIQLGRIQSDYIMWDSKKIVSAIDMDPDTIKISSKNINLEGAIKFTSFNTELDTFLFKRNADEVYINGGSLYANSVTADKLNAYGLTINNELDGVIRKTFSIGSDGLVEISGNVKSFNYNSENKTGWNIDPNGDAEFNSAVVRGKVILPNAGMTDETWGGKTKFRHLLNSKIVVSNPNDEIYSQFTVAPPVGAVFNNINPFNNNLSTEIDMVSTCWTLINLAELYKNIGEEDIKTRALATADFIVNSLQNADFYTAVFKYMPNSFSIVNSVWTPKTNFFHVRNQSLGAFALLYAYELTNNLIYKAAAQNLIDAVATWYQNVDTRVNRAELASYMSGGIYNTIKNTGTTFAPDWQVFSNTSSDMILMAAEKYIGLFGDATRTDAEGVSYTISAFKNRIKTYLQTNYSAMVATTGHKLIYNFAKDVNWDGNVTHMNWDFINDVWGTDQWFTTDLMLWGIRTFALVGLYDEAKTLVNKLYELRDKTRTDGYILMYDRYLSTGEKYDTEVSVDFSALMYGLIELINKNSTPMSIELAPFMNTIELTQIDMASSPNIDGAYYWNTFPNEQSMTETKTLCEILYYTPIFSTISSPIRIWAGADEDNRNNAPFIVYQDGTIKATKGLFEGTFSGEIHIGNIHITDTNSTSASIKINTNNDASTLIKLEENLSFINTPFVFGNETNKYLYIDGTTKKSELSDMSFEIKQTGVTAAELKDVYFPNSKLSPLIEFKNRLYNFDVNGGVFEFNSKSSGGAYDFKFDKANGDVSVLVDGDLEVSNYIKFGKLIIQKKTDTNNNGIDFIFS